MHDFVFHNPTRVLFGRGSISSTGPETAVFGKNVLLAYGQGSIKKNGIYDQVLDSLKKEELNITEFNNIRPNPTLSHVRKGVELARKNNIDVIVAVGGGSVIDSAKAIAAGAHVDHDVWQFFRGRKSIRKALPVITVLTLAASGSEMNSGMVLTNEEKKQKFGFANRYLYPKVSILDPTATFSVPKNQTAYGAVDCIAHVLEFYCTTHQPYTPVQDRIMEGLILTAMESCEQLLVEPENYQARATFMWNATLALNGFTGAGLGKVGFPMHLIEHTLSAFNKDIAHGAGLAVVIPSWLKWQAAQAPERIAQLARRVFHIDKENDFHTALAGIERLQQWFESIDCPVTLADLNISEADIPALAEATLPLAKVWRMREYTRDAIEKILSLSV
jgi:alcohol dehydrogenase YqhD (iron-dependent ADH family)